MIKSTLFGLTAFAALAGGVMPAAAQAQSYRDYGYSQGYNGYQPVRYERNRRYYSQRNRYYRGNNRCYDKGNGGLAIGGIAGGLLGNQVAGRGDRTLGTVLGAAAGALAGRAIDKSDGRRC
jgi:uncharacterized protein YcfJ